jgi:hypothetical protein
VVTPPSVVIITGRPTHYTKNSTKVIYRYMSSEPYSASASVAEPVATRLHANWAALPELAPWWQLLTTGDPDSIKQDLSKQYGVTDSDGTFRGIRYFDIVEPLSVTLLELLPWQIRDHFRVAYMEITSPHIIPHRDNGTAD